MGGGISTNIDNHPDPAQAGDMAEFVRRLDQLRVQRGEPSYRTLARRVGPLLRPPRQLAHSTVATLFQPDRRRLDQDLLVGIVSALTGGDAAIVDAWRRAYLRIQREVKTGGPAGVFRQLPADLATFTGRESVLKRLLDTAIAAATQGSDTRPAAGSRANTVVLSAIEGMAGVGKTQLAIHAAHELVRAGHYSDVQLFVNLRGFDPELPPADPASVLDAFLRQLEVPAQQVPALLAERAAMFRDRMHGKRALVLLDNAADEHQVRDLIPAGPECLVLVTSRRTLAGLEGAETHLLDVFDTAEALELLARIVGADRVAAEPEAAAEIVEACGHLPLAVSLAAARLRARPSWTLAALAERLRDDGLDEVRIGGAVHSVFDLSYRDLPERARRLYRRLALIPGRDFTVPAVAALTGTPVNQARSILEHLQDQHLLQQKVWGRYELHDLLREYATRRTQDEDDEATRDAALRGVQLWLLHTADGAALQLNPNRTPFPLPPLPTGFTALALADRDRAMAWFDAERANLAAATESAAESELAWLLAGIQLPYFKLSKAWDPWIATHHIGLAEAEKRGDRYAQARMHAGLGTAKSDLHDFDAALTHYQAALTLFGVTHPLEAMRALGNLAALHGQRHELEASIGYSKRVVKLARDCGDRYSEAVSLGNIGTAYAMLHRYDESAAHLEAALTQREALGDDYGQGMVLTNLGQVYGFQDRLAEAEDCLRRSLTVQRRCGDRRGQANALNALGEIAYRGGDFDAAREQWTEALAVFEDLGDPDAAEVRDRLDKILVRPDHVARASEIPDAIDGTGGRSFASKAT